MEPRRSTPEGHAPGAPTGVSFVQRVPFFYGWVIMLAGTLGMIMTSPGQTYATSIFIEGFIADLGISRTLVSTLYTLGTLSGAPLLPLVGRLVDRHGSRKMVTLISVLFGMACLYMSTVRGAVMLGLGFFLLRFLGQGSLQLVSQNAINQWWVRHRGKVLGISGMLSALLGAGGFPNLIHALIPRVGWRGTYLLLGGALLVVMAPLGALLFRNRPEDHSLQPDGGSGGYSRVGGPTIVPAEDNWTSAEAIRTPAFWIVSISMAAIGMLGTGLTFHMVSIFQDSGLSAAAAAAVFVPLSVTTALTNLTSGVLVDRFPVKVLLAVALFLQAGALLMAPYLTSVALGIAYGIVLGVIFGLMRTVGSVVWPAYYGRLHLGSITGITSTIGVVGSALGPLPMGLARDLMGSYGPVLMVSAVLPLGLSALSLTLRRPERATPAAP